MSDLILLYPELLWLALPIVPLVLLGAFRLVGLSRRRRWGATGTQLLAILMLLGALAQPALARPDDRLYLALVLDASASLSDAGRARTVAYAQEVLAAADPATEVEIIATGRRAIHLDPTDLESAIRNPQSAIRNATDLAAGLRLAGSLLPDSGRRRVVLLSDGWETQGQAADEAARLAARGIDVRAVALEALGNPEVIVRSLTTPPYVRIGDTIQADVQVFSTHATPATLRLVVDGQALPSRVVTLAAGENLIPLEPKAQTPGFHSLQVALEPVSDTVTVNNTAGAAVVVKREPQVLVLVDRFEDGDALGEALRSQQMRVDVRNSNAIPARAEDLEAYDSIVLQNVAATSMTFDQQRTLQEYVRRSGRGLVVVGGGTSYAKGGYADSVFEDILPVSSDPAPRPEKGRTALVLILDRSASMEEGRHTEDGVTKFEMAKTAARLALDDLREGDTLGILSFDTENDWVVPLQQITSAADKESIERRIMDLRSGGGTNIYPAVAQAAEALRGVSTPAKHLVLLTDGREAGRPDYGTLLAGLRADGISLSTIGIGRDVDTDLLTRLAKLTEGRYYFTERVNNIPKIVFKELDLTLKEAVIQGAVQPHVLAPSPVLRGFAPQDLPQLGGYSITTAKAEAVTALVSDQGDPLLAHWHYGLGRVVAFTGGLSALWGGQWLTWGDFAQFWSQAVRWSMPIPVERALQPAITVSPAGTAGAGAAGLAHLAVESLNADNTFADLAPPTAAVRAPSGAVASVELAQVAPGRYEVALPLAEPGAYEVRLERRGGVVDNVLARETAGFSVPPDPELLHAGANTRLLSRLTGGRPTLTTAAQALERTVLPGTAPEPEPLWPYLLAPALLLLLVSVAIRRVDVPWRRRPAPAAPPA